MLFPLSRCGFCPGADAGAGAGCLVLLVLLVVAVIVDGQACARAHVYNQEAGQIPIAGDLPAADSASTEASRKRGTRTQQEAAQVSVQRGSGQGVRGREWRGNTSYLGLN